MKKAAIVLALVAFAGSAYAGKTDDIVVAAKSNCSKDLTKQQALKLIKKVFLTCKSGAKVDIGGCQISCMKANTGSIVGGK